MGQFKKNNPGCNCCGGGGSVPCVACPDGYGPTNGVSFGISGFANQQFSRCDCTAYDATYNVPNFGTCSGYQLIQGCYDIPSFTYEAYELNWYIVGAASPYDWYLELQIIFRQGFTYPVTLLNSYRVAETIYRCSLTDTTECHDLSSETMSYVVGSLYDPSGQSCANLTGLTIDATSY